MNLKLFNNYPVILVLLLIPMLCITEISAEENFYQTAAQRISNTETHVSQKCGFPLILQAHTQKNTQLHQKLEEWTTTQETWQGVLISPSGHFKIHYDTTGFRAVPGYDRDGDGRRDYLEFVANAFDRAWQIEIDSLGFLPPPDSIGVLRQQYPIYCRPIGNLYGSTELIYEIPNVQVLKYVTQILLNVNFNFVNYPGISDPIVRDSLAIAATAAHEFNHALQMGYRLWEDPIEFWFIESSATYMEEVVAGEVNDYLFYLPSFYRGTAKPIDESSNTNIDYGKVLLEIMLGEMYGKDITRKIWEEIESRRAKPALEAVLGSLGTNIHSELSRLSSWMFFSGSRAVPDRFFPDAALFPEIDLESAVPVQSVNSQLVSDSLPRLAFRWYGSEVLGMSPFSFLLRSENGQFSKDISSVTANPLTGDTLSIPSNFGYQFEDPPADSLFFSVINGHNSGSEFFHYQVLTRPQPGSQLSKINVYPQPLELSEGETQLNFVSLPGNSEIYIFSANGRLLHTLKNRSDKSFISWDLRTKNGEKLGSGVYLYKLKSDTQEKLGKFVVVR